METGNVVYTGKTRTSGGRMNGVARSSDGRLDIKLSKPGSKGEGTNPEQLFAAGWSACFEGAMEKVAHSLGLKLPNDTAIEAEVDLVSKDNGYFLQARLNVSVPGMDKAIAQQLVDGAHQICPYSKAIKGNVDVEFSLL